MDFKNFENDKFLTQILTYIFYFYLFLIFKNFEFFFWEYFKNISQKAII
jgi:hypothetical protein